MMKKRIKNKFNGFSLKKLIFGVSIIVAFLFLVLVLGKKIESPLKTSIKAMNVLYYYEEDNDNSAIVNEYGERVSFLNREKEVIRNVDFDVSSPITNITGILKHGKYYYLFGSKKEKDSTIIENDRVVKYSSDFNKYEIVFDMPREIKGWNEQIANVVIENEKLYVSVVCYERGKSSAKSYVYCVDLNTKEKKLIYDLHDQYVYDIKYNPKTDNVYLVRYIENFKILGENSYGYIDVLNKHHISRFNVIDKENIVWHDYDNDTVYLNDKTLINGIYTIGNNNNGNNIICLTNDFTKLIRINIETNQRDEYSGFKYSLKLIIFMWLKFISVIYILILLGILVVKSIIKLYKDKKFEILKNILLVFVMAIIVFYISIFYIKYNYEKNVKVVKNELNAICGFLSRTIDDGLIDSDLIMPENDNMIEYLKCFSIFDKTFGSWLNDEIENEEYVYSSVYKMNNNNLITLYDSTYYDVVGSVFKISDEVKEKIINDDVHYYESSIGKVLCKFLPIYDTNGKLNGVIELGYDYNILLKQIFSSCLELSINILLFLTIIYIFCKEVVSFYKSFKKYIIDKAKHINGYAMIHSFSFFHFLAGSLDGAIFVLISKDILEANSVSESEMLALIAIPTFLIGVGYFLSYFLYTFLTKKYSVYKVSFWSSVFTTICLVFIVFVIYTNNYFLFCIAIFFISIVREILYFTLYYLPTTLDNDRAQYDAMCDVNIGCVSASVIGTLLGGFISQNFGNTALYLAEFFLSIPLILLFFFFMPKEVYYINEKNILSAKDKVLSIVRVMMKPSILVFILLILFPIVVVGGYKSFIFPLFTTELKWTKSYIANFTVLTRVLVVVIIDYILNSVRNIDQRKVAIYCLVIMGIVFMGFYINNTALWILTVLFIVEVFVQTISLPKNMLWLKGMQYFNINKSNAMSILILLGAMIVSFKDMFLSMLIMVAGNRASVLLGLFCIICGILFAILSKNSLVFTKLKKNGVRFLIREKK